MMAEDIDGDLETDRVRELEAMVQKLKRENKMLLTKVDHPETEKTNNGYDSDEDCLNECSSEVNEDEWLYTSPVRPPTKEQKKLTPSQWLEEGRIDGGSLKETQKVLTFTLDEEEQFSSSRKRSPRAGQLQSVNRATVAKKRQDHEHQFPSDYEHTNRQTADEFELKRHTHVIDEPVISNLGGLKQDSPPPMKIKWTPKAYSDSEEEEAILPPPKTVTPPISNEPVTASLKVKWDPSKAPPLTDSESEEEDNVVPATRQWNVKQVPVTVPAVQQVSDEAELEDENVIPQGKWKVKQVPSESPPKGTAIVPQNKWKVRQVPDELEEEEETTLPPQRKWNVKQVSDVPQVSSEEETIPQQGKWKVKQVSDVPQVSSEEETIPQQRKWKVKQVPSGGGSTPVVGGAESSSPIMLRKSHASVQRSGTFTKVDRKLVRPRVPPSTAATTPPTDNPLKVKWTPPKMASSQSSSEEDISGRSPSQDVSGEEPNFTSYPTLTRPVKGQETAQAPPTRQQQPTQQRGISPIRHSMSPQQRGVSPVLHGASPLQYTTRKVSGEGVVRTSRSPSPVSVLPTSSLRPPSPRRTGNLPTPSSPGQSAVKRQLPSPGRMRSPRQQTTPPSKVQSPGQQVNVAPGTQRIMYGGENPAGKRGSGLVAPSGPRGRGLVSPSSRGPRQAIPVSKHVKGGGVGMKQSVKPSKSDDGWLDGCY